MAWAVEITGYDLSVAPITNLALYSDTFQNAVWTKSNALLTDNGHTDPFGGATAADFKRVAGGACNVEQNIPIPGGTVGRTFTFSLWVAGGSFAGTLLLSIQDSLAVAGANVTVTPGAYTRYSVTLACGAGSGPSINVFLQATTTGTAGESLAIYGAQLEMSTTVGTYVPTTTASATLAPGTKTVVYAMGPGIAFSDAPYAPSGFLSWKSANQKVDTAAAGGVTLQADNGQLDLQNLPDAATGVGPLDFLTTWAWPNTRANLYSLYNTLWADRILVDSATMSQPLATIASPDQPTSTLAFPLADPRATLTAPLQPTKYLGNNLNGLGVEGEADILGLPKPILYGVVSNVPGVRVNAALLIYQVADVAATILCVRDGGLALATGTIRGSLSSLQSTTPAPGSYDIYAGVEGTFIKLGTTPIFKIAIDCQEGTSGANRTNLLLWSEDPTHSPWSNFSATLALGVTGSPDGLTNGTMITRNATGNSGVQQSQTVSSSVGNTYTFSAFVKGGTHTGNVRIQLKDAGGVSIFNFDVSLTSEWQRVSISGTFLGGSSATIYGQIYAQNTIGAIGDTFYVWGAQLEQSAAATQYIPTTTAQVTLPGMSGRTHAQIWNRLRQARCSTLSSRIDAATVAACDALDNNEVGFWWNAEATQLDAINEILTSLSGFEVEGFDFIWRLQKLERPIGPTVLDFVVLTPQSQLTAKSRAIRNLTLAWPGFAPAGIPPYLVNVMWGRSHQTFAEADFAGAAPQRLRDKFKLTYRTAPAQNNAVWNPATKVGPWYQAPSLTVNTAYQPGADGLTALHARMEAQRLLDLYEFGTQQFQLDFTPEPEDTIEVGDVVSITHPQMGLSGGPLFLVLQSFMTVSLTDLVPRMTLVLGFQT